MGSARLSELLSRAEVPTPAYFYDLDGMQDGARRVEAAFGERKHLTAYAVKANSAGKVLQTFAREGLGLDVVSGGELSLALAVGVAPGKIVMSGVAKTDAELDQAIQAEIYAIQAESAEEVTRLAARARSLGRRARVALRVNPGVEIDSHAHISTGHDAAKFGVPARNVPAAFERIDAEATSLVGVGLSMHIGSMQSSPDGYRSAAEKVAELARARRSRNSELEYVNFGGGFGVDYGTQPSSPPEAFVSAAIDVAARFGLDALRLCIEPGRAMVAPFGVLVARVVQAKVTDARRWLMLDAGMNDLLRPALYAAHHRVEPLERAPEPGEWRVVGPVCESSDDFGSHVIGEQVPELVAIREAGAYGYVMASEYNGRALPAEVFVSGGKIVGVLRGRDVASWVASRLGA